MLEHGGALRAAAELKLPLNVVGLIPTCENMPSGRANKPGERADDGGFAAGAGRAAGRKGAHANCAL